MCHSVLNIFRALHPFHILSSFHHSSFTKNFSQFSLRLHVAHLCEFRVTRRGLYLCGLWGSYLGAFLGTEPIESPVSARLCSVPRNAGGLGNFAASPQFNSVSRPVSVVYKRSTGICVFGSHLILFLVFFTGVSRVRRIRRFKVSAFSVVRRRCSACRD